MKAVYLRGVTSGVRVMGAFINAISHRLSVRISESHDDSRYESTMRNGAEAIPFCELTWKGGIERRKEEAEEIERKREGERECTRSNRLHRSFMTSVYVYRSPVYHTDPEHPQQRNLRQREIPSSSSSGLEIN